MTQPTLFEAAAIAAAAGPPWRRQPGEYRSSCGARWYLGDTGFAVLHCGHPTALWPWHGLRPDGSMILAPNGLAFQTVKQAKAATEEAWRQSRRKTQMSRRDLSEKYGSNFDARRLIREAIRAELPGGAELLDAQAKMPPHSKDPPYREVMALLRRATDHLADEIRRRYGMLPQSDQPSDNDAPDFEPTTRIRVTRQQRDDG